MDIYFFNITVLRNKNIFQKKLEEVDSLRKERIGSIKNRDDRLRSLGAGILINFIKKQYQINCELKIDRRGKPYFENADMYFNISHSGSYVVAAVSEKEIGIDIQKVVPDKHREAEKNFLPKECDYINAPADSREQWQRFCEVWTIKEAYLKNIGMGLRTPLNSFEIDFSGETPKISGKDNFRIVQFLLDKNYVASICADRSDGSTKIEEVIINK